MALRLVSRLFTRRMYSQGSLYEPDYLELLKPKYPIYNTLNFSLKGYDFPLLENYQRFIHRIADNMNLEVTDSWAQAPQNFNIQKFKPQSSVVESEYKLTVYERVVQIENLQAPHYPLFLRIIQAALPEGVTLHVHEHTQELEDARYVPDRDLKDLKEKLDELGGPTKKK